MTVTVIDVDEPADISFAAAGGVTATNNALSVDENHDGSLAAFSARDPENKAGLTYTWSLGGSDWRDFAITDAGVLSFAAVPDFERPADSGGNNVDDITVSARDSDNMLGTVAVAVTVTNKEEGGALGLSSPQPQADADYTATLSDPDEVSSTTWTWERSTSRNGPWTAVTGAIDGVTTSVYTPVAGDVGRFLRVSAAYTDGHGPDKSRSLVSANSVRAAPVTNVAPSFDESAPTRRVRENARARAAVGAAVTATDSDSGDVVTYELSGSALFTIDSDSGRIRVADDDSLDYETAPSHSVTVKASDPSNASGTVAVTIEVTDINEPPDVEADTARASEDGAVTIDVLVNDSDPEHDRSALTLRVITNPLRGSAIVNEPANPGQRPTITYTPRADYHGSGHLHLRGPRRWQPFPCEHRQRLRRGRRGERRADVQNADHDPQRARERQPQRQGRRARHGDRPRRERHAHLQPLRHRGALL